MLTETLLAVVVGLVLIQLLLKKPLPKNAPPHVPSSIPFLGSAISYGIDPVKFLTDAQKKVRKTLFLYNNDYLVR